MELVTLWKLAAALVDAEGRERAAKSAGGIARFYQSEGDKAGEQEWLAIQRRVEVVAELRGAVTAPEWWTNGVGALLPRDSA